jgi:hypothetical protein
MSDASALREENARLKARVSELEGIVSEAAARPKIAAMSAEVVDSNPYSRLMALQVRTVD